MAELGIGDGVTFTGFRNDIPQLTASMDVCVVPSLLEACGRAVLEGMATARPVVASRVGGNPELIGHRETGLLFPSDDHVSLADQILSLLSDDRERRRMGAAARERVVREFSIEANVRRTEKLYLELMRRGG